MKKIKMYLMHSDGSSKVNERMLKWHLMHADRNGQSSILPIGIKNVKIKMYLMHADGSSNVNTKVASHACG